MPPFEKVGAYYFAQDSGLECRYGSVLQLVQPITVEESTP